MLNFVLRGWSDVSHVFPFVSRLLTPPETPLFPSSDGFESQPKVAVPRSTSLVRSSSISKPSRVCFLVFGVSQCLLIIIN